MWRVSQCCCGCSLRTGTLILLSCDLFGRSSSLYFAVIFVAYKSFKNNNYTLYLASFILAFRFISFIIIIYALVGAIKRRPSYLLPYLILYAIDLIFSVLVFVILLLILFARTDKIIDLVYNIDSKGISHFSEDKHLVTPKEKDLLRQKFLGTVFHMGFFWLLAFCLNYYFFCVIYSYYKQLQEEGDRTLDRSTRVLSSASQDQPRAPYRPQPTAALYPQIWASNPPQ